MRGLGDCRNNLPGLGQAVFNSFRRKQLVFRHRRYFGLLFRGRRVLLFRLHRLLRFGRRRQLRCCGFLRLGRVVFFCPGIGIEAVCFRKRFRYGQRFGNILEIIRQRWNIKRLIVVVIIVCHFKIRKSFRGVRRKQVVGLFLRFVGKDVGYISILSRGIEACVFNGFRLIGVLGRLFLHFVNRLLRFDFILCDHGRFVVNHLLTDFGI